MQPPCHGNNPMNDISARYINPSELLFDDGMSDLLSYSTLDSSYSHGTSNGSTLFETSDGESEHSCGYKLLGSDMETDERSGSAAVSDSDTAELDLSDRSKVDKRLSDEFIVLSKRVVNSGGQRSRHYLVVGWIVEENLELFKELTMWR
ncbi:hypothetical protein BO94DRAFT_530501 [Aspergillus sclerotioniger CBS 115572]|uniref:Uncharacterized protein n=1 Tax=Aspergillus sclerotioniger CBS 115572 TaxID=1450535 RepID=A0A317XAY6_9EURO|nr:hypothetical protein BO94DRAFT_530501 [Aspergillus sclerotioniger CBS 115572]PWY95766.1 hypothetical protein BO94DRAFT_530501 [Aspergillus sclerotioniger CBS 115572]